MADNRMILVHIPTGKYVYIAKRFDGWESAVNTAEEMNKFFNDISKEIWSEDDLALVLEKGERGECEHIIDKWIFNDKYDRIEITGIKQEKLEDLIENEE